MWRLRMKESFMIRIGGRERRRRIERWHDSIFLRPPSLSDASGGEWRGQASMPSCRRTRMLLAITVDLHTSDAKREGGGRDPLTGFSNRSV